METLNNGYTPYIGVNGNWYIANEDTGMKAQGPKGEQGPVGSTGAQGIIGPKGDVGDRGPQGIRGPMGATGEQGPKGDKGDTGFTGAKGDKGDTPSLTANLLATVPGTALDATMGKVLNDRIAGLTPDDPWHDMMTPGQYYARYTKRVGIVTVQIYLTSTAPETGYADIGLVLPVGYRPVLHYFDTYLDDLALETRPILVDTAGNINPYVAAANTQFDVITAITFATS